VYTTSSAVILLFTGFSISPSYRQVAWRASLFFLGGVAGDDGQKAAGIVVVLLLWRIARIIDGLPFLPFLFVL